MKKSYFLIFGVATAIVFLITPTIRYFALKFSIIDRREDRKIHSRVIARFGGLSIYFGFVFAMLMLFVLKANEMLHNFGPVWIIIMAATLILFLGFYDDIRGTNAKVKLFVQILAALVLINAGFEIKAIASPFGGPIRLGVFSVPITILWLVGITNAINLIDGLDGLAAGIVMICSFGLFTMFLCSGAILPAFFAIALAGACSDWVFY